MSSSKENTSLKAGEDGPYHRSSLGGILRSPGSGTIKAVQIAEPPDSISPLMKGASKDVDDFNLDRTANAPKQHRTNVASSRMTGRPSATTLRQRSSKSSLLDMPIDGGMESTASTRPTSYQDTDGLSAKIAAWIDAERTRRATKKARRKSAKTRVQNEDQLDEFGAAPSRRDSDTSSEGSAALEKLQELINHGLSMADRTVSRKGSVAFPRRPSRAKLRRPSTASDTDFTETEDLVPTCDVILDNSKTLSYHGGKAEFDTTSGERPSLTRAPSSVSKDSWKSFKFEIVRLCHTLRLTGWRRVPMRMSSQITVIRLSGALTNAVYEVLPPKELPSKTTDTVDGTVSSHPKSKPQKLLLRIYGTNVDNLIDRESELQILRRLRRKNIGPRLLGCFSNGRFEEFFHAQALKPHDLHDPSISVQIAKRMRELHEGIDLLPLEREDGPFVWQNINRWKRQCQQIVTWLDTQTKDRGLDVTDRPPLVCGTEWSQFINVVEQYQAWLYDRYGGSNRLKQHLVFAHNDTQYGNILRMTPESESPLLAPANQHKRLQVIDFEYANANMPGLEFANHFSEWCYNYHDEKAPHACNTKYYPTLEEQKRFLHAYLTHKPNFSSKGSGSTSANPSTPGTPALGPHVSSLSTSLISNFMLDSRNPLSSSSSSKDFAAPDVNPDEEIEREIENEIIRLHHETRIWRLANSAQWVMWGVLRAKIPGLPDFDDPTQSAAVAAGSSNPNLLSCKPPLSRGPSLQSPISEEDGTDPLGEMEKQAEEDFKDRRPDPVEEGTEEETEEFDYLGYSFERALFFWGDAVGLGLVKKEDLPEIVKANIKIVDV